MVTSLRDRLVGKIPHNGAQLGLDMETDTMIDKPEVGIIVKENVPAFSIGVVDYNVEQGYWSKPFSFFRGEIKVVEVRIVVDEELQ